MKPVFVNSFNIISAIGNTALENYHQVANGISGVQPHNNKNISDEPFPASLIDDNETEGYSISSNFSRYEKLLVKSVEDALLNSSISAEADDTIFIFSTTKGNIFMLDNNITSDVNLMESALKVTSTFKNKNQPVVISNACISGVVALLYARRILETGKYNNAIVVGADCITKFIHSGFYSFQALSPTQCKPFSASRDGINLGEAAATIILSVNKKENFNSDLKVLNGAITNDSNHISGPSRTGEELANAIEKAIHLSGISKEDISFISAHGTATLFNDEMEAKAIHLSGLENVPVNSLKGYFGHTLGAAGLVESIIGLIALSRNEIIPTAGYENPSVEPSVKINNTIINSADKKHFLKTASGFGGCNAALVFSKS